MAGVLSLNGTFTYPIELLKTLTVDDSATFKKSITIGEDSFVDTDVFAVAYGKAVAAKRNYSIVLGNESTSNALFSIAAGYKAMTGGDYAIALGMTPNASHQYSFVWSGVVNDAKYQSKGDGTFCINPAGAKPESSVYIGNSTLTSLIESYAKAYVNAQPNTFAAKCTFKGGVEVNTEKFEIKSGSFSTDSSVETTLNGKTTVVTQESTDRSSLAASTEFVQSNIDTCVLKEGSTMTGYLTLHADPTEDMHAATRKYVDDNATVVTVDNTKQLMGSEIASVTVDGTEKKIYAPKIVAGQNTTVSTNSNDGTVKISCNPDITVAGGTLKVPIGTIIPFAGNGTPNGFLFCDGSAVSRTEYSDLFKAIGTTFGGGDGVSTFNLPNLSDNRFMEGSASNGTYRDAGLPNITGKGGMGEARNGGNYQKFHDQASGAFYFDTSTNYYGSNGGIDSDDAIMCIDASRCSSIYGSSTTVQPKSVTIKYFIKYTQTSEEKYVISVNEIKPDDKGNVSFNGLRERYEFVPLIDWNYSNPTISASGVSFNWKETTTNVNYRSVYDDGRYARYVFPLKDDFMNYDKILFLPTDYSNDGTPDLDCRCIETAVFDFMLSFPKNPTNNFIYSINTPNNAFGSWNFLWMPYNGSNWYSFSQAARSTRTRLVTAYYASYCYPMQEIYGLRRIWQ